MKTGPHSPAARRKAAATYRRRTAERKAALAAAGGTTTTIDVSSLPARPPRPGVKAKRKPHRTPAEWSQTVAQVRAALARGTPIKAACKALGIADNSYYLWSKKAPPALATKLNGHRKPDSVVSAGAAVVITLKVSGVPHEVTLEEARSIHAGLDALLRAPT